MFLSPGELYSFISIILAMLLSPGPNQILVMQSGITLGHQAAVYNAFGIATALLLHALLSGLGISLLIVQSPQLYQSIKVLGAGYIVYLGIISLYRAYLLHNAGTDEASRNTDQSAPLSPESRLISYKKGFTANLLNIQTIFIFLALFPQYMHPEHSMLIQSAFLSMVFILLQAAWYTILIFFISRLRHYLLTSNIQMLIKGASGVILIAMGIRIFLRQ